MWPKLIKKKLRYKRHKLKDINYDYICSKPIDVNPSEIEWNSKTLDLSNPSLLKIG
jgi:hypothetical protein